MASQTTYFPRRVSINSQCTPRRRHCQHGRTSEASHLTLRRWQDLHAILARLPKPFAGWPGEDMGAHGEDEVKSGAVVEDHRAAKRARAGMSRSDGLGLQRHRSESGVTRGRIRGARGRARDPLSSHSRPSAPARLLLQLSCSRCGACVENIRPLYLGDSTTRYPDQATGYVRYEYAPAKYIKNLYPARAFVK